MCERSGVKLQRKVIATLVAMLGVSPAGAAVPLIALQSSAEPPRQTEDAAPAPEPGPSISFSVPKYTLTPSERELVASCLILEAANQGEYGMRGVMSVIRNRARHRPELFAPVVLRDKQFSALNTLTSGRESLSRVVKRAQRDRMWGVALTIVDDAVRDEWHDPTGGATHYTRTGERTPWTRALARTATIGRHAFYR